MADTINDLKNDIEGTKKYLKSQQYIFEQQLKNGMGEEMKEYLSNPPIPQKKTFKDKIKKILKIKK